MPYYKDFHDYLAELDKGNLLTRIKRPINKDTELHPLVRLQFRGLPEEKRKAFIFENVVDSKGKRYRMPVAVSASAGSTSIYAKGMKCKPGEIADKWDQAQLHPIKPVMVDSGPVYEEVHEGDNLLEHEGLGEFPIPISTPGYDIAPFITAPCVVTKDPETGIRNMGTYRVHIKSPTRSGLCFSHERQHIGIHWRICRKLGIPLQAAVVIGAAPNIGYVSVSSLPYEVDELDVAGGIAGEPVQLVKCRTVDLEVPAYAEVVLEGELSTAEVEPEAPFGEAHGYMGQRTIMPYFTVKCIAHRKDAIWHAFISQFWPSESTKIRSVGRQAAIYRVLKHDMEISSVKAVAVHESSGSNGLVVVQMDQPRRSDIWPALRTANAMQITGKVSIAVDADINPWDLEAVVWAISLRVNPQHDCLVDPQPAGTMDFSFAPPGEMEKREDPRFEDMPQGYRLLIDATMKWPYPPVSLPKKEFMDNAIKIWKEEGLPELTLKEPWYGYDLGYWTKEFEEQASLALQGDHYKTGEVLAKRRKTLD